MDKKKEIPRKGTPGWKPFLIKLLQDDELADGIYPTCAGLQRVCQMVYGNIIAITSSVVKFPTESDGTATVTCSVTCTPYTQIEYDENDNLVIDSPIEQSVDIRTTRNAGMVSATGSVNVSTSDMPDKFKPHLIASAETKAQGRALRRLLCLDVYTKEEMSSGEIPESDNMTNLQKASIKKQCENLSINLPKFLAIHAGLDEENFTPLNITKDKATSILSILKKYKDVEIPKEIQNA